MSNSNGSYARQVVLTVGVEKSTADWIKANARHSRAQGQVVDRLVEEVKRRGLPQSEVYTAK